MTTNTDGWIPMDTPPNKPGKYMTRTEGDCWLIGFFEPDGWAVPGSEGETLTHWKPLQ